MLLLTIKKAVNEDGMGEISRRRLQGVWGGAGKYKLQNVDSMKLYFSPFNQIQSSRIL